MNETDAQLPAAPAAAPVPPASAAQPALTPVNAAWLWLLLAGLALLGLVGNVLLWGKLSGIQHSLAENSAQAMANAQEAKAMAQASSERSDGNQAKLALLDAKLQEQSALNQQLEVVLQQATRTQNSNLLTDLEAGLRLAQQQAQFTRNPQPLLDALVQAKARLEQAGDGAVLLKPAQQAVERDMARLKAANYADSGAAIDKLDTALQALDELPLWADAPAPMAAAALAAHVPPKHAARQASASDKGQGRAVQTIAAPSSMPSWWLHAQAWGQELGGAMWQTLRDLVRVERMDQAAVFNLDAQQGRLVREQFKLDALGVRAALLSGRVLVAQQNLGQILARLPQYFDDKSAAYERLAATLRSAQADLAGGSDAAPQAADSIAVMAQLNERLSTAALPVAAPAASSGRALR